MYYLIIFFNQIFAYLFDSMIKINFLIRFYMIVEINLGQI